jgi:hypothetical protein
MQLTSPATGLQREEIVRNDSIAVIGSSDERQTRWEDMHTSEQIN